jgi:hypothetical protein
MALEDHPSEGRYTDGRHGQFRSHPELDAETRLTPVPRPGWGTCINEAAIVAADFPYQPVYAVEDMPDCFSRPICALTMQLNDEASDEERQLLLPFVIRLACADTAEVEQQRNVYIASRLRYCRSFGEGIDILEGALAMGRRADELAPEQVGIRLDAVQRGAATAALGSTLPALFHIGIGFVPIL